MRLTTTIKTHWKRIQARRARDKSALLTFLFHGIFRDDREAETELMDAQQRITVAHFRRFVEYYLESGYAFVAPEDIPHRLEPGKNYVLATFDDGYYNNLQVVPVLKEFSVPAVFYISTNHVKENMAFWWDVVYRESKKRHLPWQKIPLLQNGFKDKTHEELHDFLAVEYGVEALKPVGDLDRPMTPTELASFAREPWVHLGNHTSDHAILTNYSYDGCLQQIEAAQQALKEMCQITAGSIAYPNGNYSSTVMEAATACGLNLGITVEQRKNYLPFANGAQLMQLGRFVLWGTRPIEAQCEIFRTDRPGLLP